MTNPYASTVLLALLVFSVSCNSAHQLDDAKPVELSPFIEHQDEVRRMPSRSPFHYTWSHKSRDLSAAQESRRTIYVAPVEVEGMGKAQALAQREQLGSGESSPVGEIARYAQSAFPQSFLDSPSPRYRIVEEAVDDSVILELLIIHLDPANVDGGKGGLAIEGKLRDGESGELLFQFADRENSKLSYNLLGGFPASELIDEWAQQFELITRSPKWRESL
ncbi:MAG: hypothetical protein P8J87_12245 [Verrucomicrobiales bacterium]|nr:hypothetical protein [Verrucomicrobiales bacterium]